MSDDREKDRGPDRTGQDRTAPIAGGAISQTPGTTPIRDPRVGPGQPWGMEPGLDTEFPVVPDDEVRYIEQWRVYFRTDQTTYNAWVHGAHPEEPDWARMTRAQYLAALPFPGPRTFDEVADKAPQTDKKPAETVYPRHFPWATSGSGGGD